MQAFAWAQNRSKLERTKGELGPEATEDAIKSRYIEMAGFVLNDAGEVSASEEEVEEVKKPKKAKKDAE